MKKYLIFLIPGLMILNACTEGRSSFSEDQREVIENSLIGGQEDSQNSTSTTGAAPQVDGSDVADDGSHTVNPDSFTGHGPHTATPAFPHSDDNGGGNGGNNYQQVPDLDHLAQVSNVPEIRQFEDHTNLNAQAEDQGNQGSGNYQTSRPDLTITTSNGAVKVYDPFCNCYRTGPNDGPVDLKDVPQAQSTGSNEDDDDD